MDFPKGLRALVSSRDRVAFLLLVCALMCLPGAVALDASAAENAIKVAQGGRISADIVDFPLAQVLADLSQKLPIDIKGSPGGGVRLTLHFSNLTLQQALRKIMAGYNYVVIEPQPAGGRLMVTILGKADRTVREAATVPPVPPVQNVPPAAPGSPATGTLPAPAGAPPAASTPAAPPPAAGAQPPTGQPVPPPPPSEGQPPVAVVNQAPGADTAAAASGTATTATPPGVLPAPADQPEFNPAAWGGRGRRK
jgi:hypothetical protein